MHLLQPLLDERLVFRGQLDRHAITLRRYGSTGQVC